ncbi:hypothetical protein JMJ77_0006151 [Colletotrichum scovillei]|uniref:Uncharacterized protein n=1 Tax=Colletotrichum scovillei TaxID=1209932 RepID=A0A9P7UIY1_9PEZI|nr:hypothetical protein JMJ77_0006151 [Colletotrichum scovillei]KAG7077384.1 hypothetical protein JMJ76_0014632 [Colletotrichum scovillei]KAG7084530.1 hypothetical protein JMJ78_0009964 [Colletotrichum scovillei]
MGSRAAKDHQLDLHHRQHGRSSDRPIATRHPYLEEERMSRSRSRRVNQASDGSLLETARSGNGIVEDWLANVSRRGVDTRESAKRLHSNQDKSNAQTPEWRPHGISLQNAVQGGHKRAPSRDSSIIPEPVTKKARPSIAVISHGPIHRSPVTGVTDFPISVDSSPPRFEKRTRHKTREDRYDSRKKQKEKRRRAPEETTRRSEDVPKKPILSGRDVMNNFQPEAVLNDRLTLQPCLTPGLFQNGQISSPKPVGDLAYNSMISVEQPPSRECMWQRQQRLEAKARQRRGIELVEISTFLRRKETPTTGHPIAGRGRPRDGYEDQKLEDRLPENLPACDDRLSTRSITGSDSLRGDQRYHIHDKTYVAPVRHVRSSSRATTYVTWATSGNHRTSLPGNSFDRHHSSTPEPIREALRETGIFGGAETKRKARVSSHDLRRRKQEVHPDGESKNFEASREQPMIIRYLDKGVMTTDESPLSPSFLEQSRILSAVRDSSVLETTADARAEALVGSTTEQALNEPSGGEIHKDSNGESCRRAAAPTTRASTAMQAYLVPPSIDLSAKTQAIPENNIQAAQTITPNIAKATMPVAERSDVCVQGDVELGREATVNQSDEQFLAPELSAMPPGRNPLAATGVFTDDISGQSTKKASSFFSPPTKWSWFYDQVQSVSVSTVGKPN